MEASVKAAVAYVAARLITGLTSSSVFDSERGRHISMGGTVSDRSVQVYDYDALCYFSGSGDGSRFSLFHYGQSAHVNVNLSGNTFNGFDYGSGNHFSGTVTGRSVSLYDYADANYSNYSI